MMKAHKKRLLAMQKKFKLGKMAIKRVWRLWGWLLESGSLSDASLVRIPFVGFPQEQNKWGILTKSPSFWSKPEKEAKQVGNSD